MSTLSLIRGAGVALAAAVVVTSACTPGVDCAQVKPYSEISGFSDSCVACHSSALSGADRQSAPSQYNYDTYDAATGDLEELIEVLEEGEMPPSNGPQLSEAQVQEILTWAQCGAPE